MTASHSNGNIRIDRKITKAREQKWKENCLYGYFKQPTVEIAHEKTWTWLQKGNMKRETEYLLKVAQNNITRTNYIKAKIDLCNGTESVGYAETVISTVNHIISESKKLAQN